MDDTTPDIESDGASPTPTTSPGWGVLVGDVPIHFEPGEDQFAGCDDLEVRGPFATEREAQDYAIMTSRYVTLVVPLTHPVRDA